VGGAGGGGGGGWAARLPAVRAGQLLLPDHDAVDLDANLHRRAVLTMRRKGTARGAGKDYPPRRCVLNHATRHTAIGGTSSSRNTRRSRGDIPRPAIFPSAPRPVCA